ncbi:reverse transcriptase [Gossypium australe]|uniref:Reverse transcriptase n=1 Tax=Gossypium australe TaxID=47621 RepID=A0A5B6W086_9ROSI|nr:reverse transcriptase [Gossypium australe]
MSIVFIPKTTSPKNIGKFRPISLCNVIYKVVSKVIVNKFRRVMNDCIDETQWAFVSGRQISDNISIAYEIIHSIKKRKGGSTGSFALKLGMSKAYDRVEWNFLEKVMSAMGFCNAWIYLIMTCVSKEASIEWADFMKSVVVEYEGISGHNVDNTVRKQIGRILGVRISGNPKRYLGLLAMVRRRKKQTFVELKEKVIRKIKSWSTRYLSMR